MKTVWLRSFYIIVLIAGTALWGGKGVAEAQQTEASPAEQKRPGGVIPVVTQESQKRSDDLYDKGILLTVYGNDKAAIAQFKKVINLDPLRHDAYFQMGVSYGELGQFETALRHMNKAIEINPDKAVYFYGRGRVYLLSGDKVKAVSDFKKAAEMGSRDAGSYLKRIGEE